MSSVPSLCSGLGRPTASMVRVTGTPSIGIARPTYAGGLHPYPFHGLIPPPQSQAG
jgi:hypothetical protein